MKAKNLKVPNEEDIETIEKSLKDTNSLNTPYKVPSKEEPNLIYFVTKRYQTTPQEFKASAPVEIPDEEIPPEPKANYITDDSDSDLDVVVDPKHSKVPKPFNLNQLTDPKHLKDMNLKNPKLPNEESIELLEKAL